MVLHYQVFRNSQLLGEGKIEPPFQVGRQLPDEADLKPVCTSEREGVRRLVFAALSSDRSIPRKAMSIQAASGELFIQNIHESSMLMLADGRRIVPGERLCLKGEATFLFADGFRVRISQVETKKSIEPPQPMQSFRMLRSTDFVQRDNALQCSLLSLPTDHSQTHAVELVKTALRAFKEVPGTAEYYFTVVKSVVEMIDVDRALVLVDQSGEWQQRAASNQDPFLTIGQMEPERHFSRSLVHRVVEAKQTVIVEPDVSRNVLGASMQEIARAVASPIFDEKRNVVAILYADKQVGGYDDRPIGDLEASLLEVLASAVSTGLMRQRDEEFRTAAGQFFSPRVLDRLRYQKDLLQGRDTEVSVLFCDIRGFSTVSYRAGPAATIDWINDVLTRLSECVLKYDGVVVDYVGDELMAMFGAPEPQLDHARRACQAAVEMMRAVPDLHARWRELVLDKFGIGIGVNTGTARVGNTGSRVKFKYGPLGNTVNMASRIQGVTQQIGVPCLMTGATMAALPREFLWRRLTAVRVVGIAEPVQIFELLGDESQLSRELCIRYEAALGLYESQKPVEAAAVLDSILQQFRDDKPSQMLLSRVAAQMKQSDEPFDAIWTLSRK